MQKNCDGLFFFIKNKLTAYADLKKGGGWSGPRPLPLWKIHI